MEYKPLVQNLKVLHFLFLLPLQAYQYRVYTQELLQFGDQLSVLLLLPPSEEFSASYWPLEGAQDAGITMPLQIFELGKLIRTVALYTQGLAYGPLEDNQNHILYISFTYMN